jgi:hypothetical protein
MGAAAGASLLALTTAGTGTGTVAQQPVSALVAYCSNAPAEDELACYTEHLTETYNDKGLRAAADLIDEAALDRSPTAARFAARCHEAAHNLGKLVVVEPGMGYAALGPSACQSGFFHGIHSRIFATYSTTPALLAAAATICANSNEVLAIGAGGLGNGCLHAYGHELFLRGADEGASVQSCESEHVGVSDTQNAALDCLHGLYMEKFLEYENNEEWTSPAIACARALDLGSTAGKVCFSESGVSAYRYGLTESPAAAFALCTDATPSAELAMECAGGLGRAASSFLENDPEEIREFCAAGGRLYEPCLIEALTSAIQVTLQYSVLEYCTGMQQESYCRERLDGARAYVEENR